MRTGTVEGFNEQKGLGFIQPDSGGKGAFVRVGAIECVGFHGLADPGFPGGKRRRASVSTVRRSR